MSRAALLKRNIILTVVILLGLGGGAWAYVTNLPQHTVGLAVDSRHQLMQISYHGQNGQNALDLLKKHANVQTKHYSFGDMVVAINGVQGSGPKYWAFYINGKEANIGAGSYATKNSDVLTWRLK